MGAEQSRQEYQQPGQPGTVPGGGLAQAPGYGYAPQQGPAAGNPQNPYSGMSPQNPYGLPPSGLAQPSRYVTPEQMSQMMLSQYGAAQGYGGYGGYPPVPPQQQPAPLPAPRVQHAVSVRNEANLKKDTLRMSTDDAKRLFLEFTFDAASPVAITVLFGHTDAPAPSGSKASLASGLRPLRPGLGMGIRRVFHKGNAQRYSQAFDKAEFLNTTLFKETEITNAPNGPPGTGTPSSTLGSPVPPSPALAAEHSKFPPHLYPIIIILEPLREESTEAGGSIPELVLPAREPNTVIMQCTYACLLHKKDALHDDVAMLMKWRGNTSGPAQSHITCEKGNADCPLSKEWVVRPLKQRIQTASGRTFEVREIYGMGSGSSSSGGGGDSSKSGDGNGGGSSGSGHAGGSGTNTSSGSSSGGGGGHGFDDTGGGAECVVCLTDRRDTAVLPCRHMCLCHDCAQQLLVQTNKCPICRTPVQSVIQIKLHDSTSSS